ncbi:MAG: HEPN domain-containing protein [Hyalangium sp.]|uniref:HEPN domain-containing protein n=1 Tax=Hyalangium sp. TaxID=2028555 RepID=UPI003899CF9C
MQIKNVRIAGSGGPVRTISLNFELRWYMRPAIVVVTEATLRCADQLVAMPFQLPDFPYVFKKEDETIGRMAVVQLSDASIRFIEEQRAQRKGNDVVLKVEVKYRYRDVDPQKPSPALEYVDLFTSSNFNTTDFTPIIPRSEWVRILQFLGWNETEFFEVNIKGFRGDPHLEDAIEKLQEADTLFREGEYDATLSACQQSLAALESVRIAGTQVPGVDAILARCFRDESKREHVKSTIEATRLLCGLGAKETYPAQSFSRAEVEYCLSTTLGIFALLGHRLAEGTGLKITE